MSATLSEADRVGLAFDCMSARLEFGCMNTTLSEADRVGLKFGE